MTQIEDRRTGPLSIDDFVDRARAIGEVAAPFVEEHDRNSTFVKEGYRAIRELHYGAMGVPRELGGDGADLEETCAAQRQLGRACASTALAVAMHHHTVLSLAWRWRQGDDEFEPLLERIVEDDLIMASSGTLDPTNPSLISSYVDGGMIVNGKKRLSSGSPDADLLFSLVGDEHGEWIYNIAIPMDSPGVTVVDDWYGMGMRGSGSNTVQLTDVFIAEADTYMKRRRPPAPGAQRQQAGAGQGGRIQGAEIQGLQPRQGQRAGGRTRGAIPGMRMPGLMIALTVISAGYVGIADDLHDRAIASVRDGQRANNPATQRLIGEMHSASLVADMALRMMIDETVDDALGDEALFRTIMTCKRLLVVSGLEVAEKAMEAMGSVTYLQGSPFERGLRDLRASVTHPLPPAEALSEVGRSLLLAP